MKKINIKKEILEDLYFNKKLSLNQISKILKINNCVIYRRLKEYGFKLRDKFEAKKLMDQSGKNNAMYKDGRTLKKYYCKCGKEINYKAWRYGKKSCINCYLKVVGYFNKGLKRSKEIRSKYSLAKGGTGIPYEYFNYNKSIFNDQLKKFILKRDNYTCQNCGLTNKEHLVIIGQSLSIHHIDYNKMNCKENNLITLCLRCNNKVNANKNYWKTFFTNKII